MAEEGEDWKEVAAGHAPDGKGADDSTQAAAAGTFTYLFEEFCDVRLSPHLLINERILDVCIP